MDKYIYISQSGIKGMKWGIRRYQNEDGSLTPEGKIRYGKGTYQGKMNDVERAAYAKARVKAVGKQQAIADEQKTYEAKVARAKLFTYSLSALNVATVVTGNPIAGAAFVANVGNIIYQNIKDVDRYTKANSNIQAINRVGHS